MSLSVKCLFGTATLPTSRRAYSAADGMLISCQALVVFPCHGPGLYTIHCPRFDTGSVIDIGMTGLLARD